MYFFNKKRELSKELLVSPHLVVSNERLKRESSFLRRLAPNFYSRYLCISIGKRKDEARRKSIDHFFAQSPPPLFNSLQMETQNRCNGECSFCPVNRHLDPRPFARMPEELFSSILRQLTALNYSGICGFFSNNEPLLDKRLPDFLQEGRKRLPRATLTILTNGTLLNVELFRQLMCSLNTMIINDYNKDVGLHANIKEIRDYCLSPEGRQLLENKLVIIEMRSPKLVLGSRGGSSRNRKPVSRPLKALCLCMFQQFIIRPDGRLSLCCNDALGQMTLGDLNQKSILEIWNGQAFTDIRRTMAEKGRSGNTLCAGCDFPGLS